MNVSRVQLQRLGQRFMSSAAGSDHESSVKLWRNLSFFVGFPAVGLCMLNAYLKHQEEHGTPRPEFVPYEYMYRREKRFPWGDGNHTFFHNKHTNALPDGYET